MKKFLLTFAASALALTASAQSDFDWSYLVMPEEGDVTEIREIQVMFPEIEEIEISSKDDITLSLNGSAISGVKVAQVDEQTLSITPTEPLTSAGTYVLSFAPYSLSAYADNYSSYADNEEEITMTWTIAGAESALDFKCESSLSTEGYIAYFGELTLTFPELEKVTYNGSGLSVLKDDAALDGVEVKTDANKLTLTLKEALNFVDAKVEVMIAPDALTGTAADVTASNASEIKLSYNMATPVEYDLTLAISNPKPNADGEISAEKSLESLFFVCEEKGLLAAAGTTKNVTVKSEAGDYEATAHLRKASGLNANYSYFSAAFGKEPSYNGKYIITIERGAFGSEAWTVDPNFGRSNDVIELTFELVDGADRAVYNLEPLEVNPEEGTYKTAKEIASITLTYASDVAAVKGASATLAGIDTSYRSTVEFKADGKGGFTAEFDPVPTDNGKYLFTVAEGSFGDAAFVANGVGKASAPISYTYVVDSESGFNSISAAEDTAKVYNLQGMPVSTSADALPAGIYIINGKKVAVE